MAEFDTQCPYCNAALSAQEEWIGMTVECPECKKTFTIADKTAVDPQGEIRESSNACAEQTANAVPAGNPFMSFLRTRSKKVVIAAIVLLFAAIVLLFAVILFAALSKGWDRSAVEEREKLMRQAFLQSTGKQKKTIEEAELQRIKEKAIKTNNLDLLVPVSLMEFAAKKEEQALETLWKGVDSGNGGCIYFSYNVLNIRAPNAMDKAIEIKFWPTVARCAINTQAVAMLRGEKIPAEAAKLVSLGEQFLAHTKIQLKIGGDMNAACGCFLLFEDKVCYFPMNGKRPSNVTVHGKKWSNLDKPFPLDETIYPYLVGGSKKTSCIFWGDSVSIYPLNEGNFEISIVAMNKKDVQGLLPVRR